LVQNSFFTTAGLCLGMFSALALVYFGFNSPTVITRWSAGSYPLVTGLAAGAVALFAALWSGPRRVRALLIPPVLLAWNGLFVLALALALRGYSVSFPGDAAQYPFAAASAGWAWPALAAALLLHPVLFADFALLGQAAARRVTSPRALAGGVTLAALWLLLLSLGHVFTTVYDYIPVIGPLFRDHYWLVVTAAGLGLALPALLLRREEAVPPVTGRERWIPALTAGLLAILATAMSVALTATPPPAETNTSLRVLTYNLQQGYTKEGQRGMDKQLAFIRQVSPDILGLQETDTARIAGGNADVVRYYADQLKMYSYYGPSPVTGTFGIALLSRYPIENPRTFYLYSAGEQTAAILATIRVGEQTFTVLVTHLGNKGPMIQQQQVLKLLDGQPNVIAMGDFNFRADTQQYALTTQSLADGWLSAAQRQLTPPELNVERRIDHIFVSPGTRVLRAEYFGPGPSDHPAMFAEIGWE
jgi:endonuclease/exonuclease/phosphatase family metal-dependent hydrolase